MERNSITTAQKLLDSFMQVKRLHLKQSPSFIGLKHSEIMLLFSIRETMEPESAGIKISEISNMMKVATPTITQLINGLEASGFVERTMDKEDRRAVRVKLTNKARDILKEVAKELFDAFDGLVEYLGEAKSNELAELLSTVIFYFNKVRKEN